jgi:NADPH-dependent glutamate synthase beta subunit-like oxidoreductase
MFPIVLGIEPFSFATQFV